MVLLRALEHLQQDIGPDSGQRLRAGQRCLIGEAHSSLRLIVSSLSVSSDDGKKLALKLFFLLFSIFSFFERIETWFKVSSVPYAMHQKVENLKRSFHVSQLIYNDYSKMFAKLFNCSEIGDEPRPSKSRKKSK